MGSKLLASGAVMVNAESSEPNGRGLAVFTLLRGGTSIGAYDSFIHSRRCLRAAMPRVLEFDDIAFHAGDVPVELQPTLREQM
eukprot:5451588-Prymnesium_polylepis.1